MGDGLALYSSDEYSLLYCRCFFGGGVFGCFFVCLFIFVCMVITFFLGIPSLQRLCQDSDLLFLFWFEFNVPTWQQFQLNSVFLFWAVQCVLQQTKFQSWPKTGHKGKSPNWENAIQSHIWSHKVNLKSPNFRLLANYGPLLFFWGAKISCQHSQDSILKRKICLPQYYIRGHHWRDSAHQCILKKGSSLLLLLHTFATHRKVF